MRKLVILIFILALSIFAQNNNNFAIPLSRIIDSETELDLTEMYVAIDAGIDRIVDGQCRIEIEKLPNIYYVVITPLTPSGDLYYSQTEESAFIVRENEPIQSKENVVEFQYIVFTPISEVKTQETSEVTQQAGEAIVEQEEADEVIGITTTLPVIQKDFENSEKSMKKLQK